MRHHASSFSLGSSHKLSITYRRVESFSKLFFKKIDLQSWPYLVLIEDVVPSGYVSYMNPFSFWVYMNNIWNIPILLMAFLTFAASAPPFVPTKLELECARRVCGETDAEIAGWILPGMRKLNLYKLKKAPPPYGRGLNMNMWNN